MNIIIVLLGLLALIILSSLICFFKVFFSFDKKILKDNEFDIPKGKEYLEFKDKIINWQKKTVGMPFEEFNIKTFDGLNLYARYYEQTKGAPIELMFHGYKGTAKRDLSGGIQRCFSMGYNAFIVDQRAACHSDGRVITFGVKESKDCKEWINFIINHFGKDVKIILTGISMGAATVLMAAGNELPSNVIGVLSDCGYSSAADIIKKVIKDMKLPLWPVFPLIKLGALLFGGFNIMKCNPAESVKNCKIPTIFFHGDKDGFVPYEMSIENYNNCLAPKKLIITPNADHGLCYPVDEEKYVSELKEFAKEYWQ